MRTNAPMSGAVMESFKNIDTLTYIKQNQQNSIKMSKLLNKNVI